MHDTACMSFCCAKFQQSLSNAAVSGSSNVGTCVVQVRVEGEVQKLSAAESDTYFHRCAFLSL